MLDVINTIALRTCTDNTHAVRYWTGGEMRSHTLAEIDHCALKVALRLFRLGVGPRDRVGIMMRNCVEWVILDLAILKLGAVTAGFEPGRFDPPQIVKDYGLKLLFTDHAVAGEVFFGADTIGLWCADAALAGAVPALHAGYDPSDICAIKFTSGSTGVPKGLEATVASVNSSLSSVQEMFAHGPGDDILVFLRLALLQQRYWVYSAFVHGHDVTLSDIDNVWGAARAARPTVIMGVPGFYEALRARIEADNPRAAADPQQRRGAIHALVGNRVRYLWTGSAPASGAVLNFFNEGGVPLYEGYGLNETCIVAKNHPGAFRQGSVGKVLANKKIRFDKDGILIVGSRDPVNCRYTWCEPGTNEKTFLPTSEVKTYDVGYVDEEGYLYIHGRVDDILTLSSGRNVLVRLIEEKLREHPGVHECVLYGHGKPFLTAVVSPAPGEVARESLREHINVMNETLLAEQRIQAFVLASQPFSIDNGLLTSQFKPKRKDILRLYAAELALLYDARDSSRRAPYEPAIPTTF